jgi:inner membrane protein COX18
MIICQKTAAKLAILAPEMKEKEQQIMSKAGEWSETSSKTRADINMMKRDMFIKYNCHPLRVFILPLMQIPFWISMSLALRNMTGSVYLFSDIEDSVLTPSLENGGMLWFPNMLIPDATCILPIVNITINLLLLELVMLQRGDNIRKFEKIVLNLTRLFSLWIMYIGIYSPSVSFSSISN